jgi:Na+-translocating ferredoxin:NAD+ oxidoreductase RnfE subunit
MTTLATRWAQTSPLARQAVVVTPLLAPCASLVDGLVLGLACLIVITVAGTALTVTGNVLPRMPRALASLLLGMSFASSLGLLLQAYPIEANEHLGSMLPLATLSALLLMPALTQLKEQRSLRTALPGLLRAGVNCMLMLMALGLCRQLLALFSAGGTTVALAFILLGLLLTLYRQLHWRRNRGVDSISP